MLPQLRQYLLQHWSELPLGGPQPRDLAFLVQATGVSKLCCYVFAGDSPEPQWVAKMARSPRDNVVLEAEYGLIQYLRQHGSDFVRATVPGPLLTMTISGHLVGIESYLPGRPMDGLLIAATGDRESVIRKYLDLALGWLLRSQLETPVQRGQLTNKQIDIYLLEPLKQLKTTAKLTNVELAYLGRLAKRVVELRQLPLPLVFNHNDFRPGNILVDGQSIQVIDWEFGAPTALPLMDVFNLLVRVHALGNGLEEIDGYLEDYLAAFDAVFFQGSPFAKLTAECIGRACAALGLDPAWLDVLLPVFLATEANKYHTFLNYRTNQGYVYLLRSRSGQTSGSYLDQLARQKNVWLLGHLAQREEHLIFRHLSRSPEKRQQTVTQVA